MFYEHAVAPVYLVVCARVKCPCSLRVPGSTLEAALSKLKTRKLRYGGS